MAQAFITKEELLECAARYEPSPLEPELMILGKRAHGRAPPHITKAELIDLAKWKWRGGRTWQLCDQNTESEVVDISTAAFAQTHEWIRIVALTTLSGVGWPMASVILHFAFLGQRREYPILDVNALTAVGAIRGREEVPAYCGRLWSEYVACCRGVARQHGVTMRELDKALWVRGDEMRS